MPRYEMLIGLILLVIAIATKTSSFRYARRQLPAASAGPVQHGNVAYNISIITDMDSHSAVRKQKHWWWSQIWKGTLTVNQHRKRASVKWNRNMTRILRSRFSFAGRAMEMSDLKLFDGRLITVDDKTGILYRINGAIAHPWVFLADGSGDDNVTAAFKGEWMTVKDDKLIVGGTGQQWTNDNGGLDQSSRWIKVVHRSGLVEHVSWVENYKKLLQAIGYHDRGYLHFEAAQWSPIHQRWFFLPRRASDEDHDRVVKDRSGTNVMLIADDEFEQITVKRIGNLTAERGFSAFQFIPGTDDKLIVALKSVEDSGRPIASFITVFHIDGDILLAEKRLPGRLKFEGLELV